MNNLGISDCVWIVFKDHPIKTKRKWLTPKKETSKELVSSKSDCEQKKKKKQAKKIKFQRAKRLKIAELLIKPISETLHYILELDSLVLQWIIEIALKQMNHLSNG